MPVPGSGTDICKRPVSQMVLLRRYKGVCIRKEHTLSLDFRSMHSAEQLLSFHVYRVGGFLGDDKIIKAQDKITNMCVFVSEVPSLRRLWASHTT